MIADKTRTYELRSDAAAYPLHGHRWGRNYRSDHVLALSVAGSPEAIRLLRAFFGRERNGLRLVNATPTEFVTLKLTDGETYSFRTHPIVDGWVHAVVTIDDPAFLPTGSERELLDALQSRRFTTPILARWVPWIYSRLSDNCIFQPCIAYGCNPLYLAATTAQIDTIVQDGLRTQAIRID